MKLTLRYPIFVGPVLILMGGLQLLITIFMMASASAQIPAVLPGILGLVLGISMTLSPIAIIDETEITTQLLFYRHTTAYERPGGLKIQRDRLYIRHNGQWRRSTLVRNGVRFEDWEKLEQFVAAEPPRG